MDSHTLFRFRIVGAVELLEGQGHGRTDAVRLVAAQNHDGRRISRRTIWRWLKAWSEEGLEGLEPAPRPGVDGSRVLREEFLDFLAAERETDRDASIPELIRRARRCGVLHPDEPVDRTTVWRAMRRLGLETRPRHIPADGGDTRRFAYPERMQMVLLDFVHFRASFDPALRRCGVYVLDDATRKILSCRAATSENADSVLHTLADMLARFGTVDRVYCDRGPGFIAGDVARPLAALGIPLIHGRARYPQGHGKIEAFNRSLKARLLRGLRRPEVDADLRALTLRLRHDAFEVYNHLPHESLDGDSPHGRWAGSTRQLRPVDADRLREAFTITETRRVSRDHIIQFGGQSWEVPRGLSGETIEVHRRLLENDALYVDAFDRLVRLNPPDLAGNATAGRDRFEPPQTDPADRPAPKNASTMGFEKALSPMTGADGGYPASPPDPEESSDDDPTP